MLLSLSHLTMHRSLSYFLRFRNLSNMKTSIFASLDAWHDCNLVMRGAEAAAGSVAVGNPNEMKGVRRNLESKSWKRIGQKRRSGKLRDMKEGVQHLLAMEQETLDKDMKDGEKVLFTEIWSIATNEYFRRNKMNSENERNNLLEGGIGDDALLTRLTEEEDSRKKIVKTKTKEVENI
ncbi:uncharacterized protein MONOS_335 [Monocercomonoides exilis]|uniref:uncharacterized protein n=1 Tax=Monocercomonoides exilis TaxID=2049356 RepID=UPI00355AB7FE|nr:hypothetical protein MONOS_335 [Monocercomonoides exilis]|eukprot:MONOS_335.1-p1 / transcript=MONOS_335.1 / gene=MONOS_335 / organism=Monocercomonoides_exilis_PA203 / gene_product=unspecified product / transcript_product=unspecified product / location=Mono_scaffold00005:226769-227302(+) / protein_length=178 / sequence_SO=supercontig / SO=protein_coding / is_pseudo=false